jgi:excisionase family DNA binding protein
MRLESFESGVPSNQDVRVARDAVQELSAGKHRLQHMTLLNEKTHTSLPLPQSVVEGVMGMLTCVAEGSPFTVVPTVKELTTQEAADILNVSRPYLVRLLEKGEIPHRKVGARRRVLHSNILAYKQRDDALRDKVLEKLTRQAQELNMGYDD